MSSTNRSLLSRSSGTGHEYFATPSWVTALILPKLDWRGVDTVLDPCAGDGAILRAVGAFAPVATKGIEVDPDRALAGGFDCGDALTMRWEAPALVIMNPPFSLAQEFCEKACREIARGGEVAVLMRLAMLAGQKRAGFWYAHPADVFVLGKRPSFTGGGTDSADYAWFRFWAGATRRWERLDP